MTDKERTTVPAWKSDAKRLKRRKLDDDLSNLAETLHTIIEERDELQKRVKELEREIEKEDGSGDDPE